MSNATAAAKVCFALVVTFVVGLFAFSGSAAALVLLDTLQHSFRSLTAVYTAFGYLLGLVWLAFLGLFGVLVWRRSAVQSAINEMNTRIGSRPLRRSRFNYAVLKFGTGVLLVGCVVQAYLETRRLFDPSRTIADTRIERIERWQWQEGRRAKYVDHDVITLSLAGLTEKFSIHQYEPGYGLVRSLKLEGMAADLIVEAQESNAKTGHKILELSINGNKLVDRLSSRAYRASRVVHYVFSLSWLVLLGLAVLIGLFGAMFVRRKDTNAPFSP